MRAALFLLIVVGAVAPRVALAQDAGRRQPAVVGQAPLDASAPVVVHALVAPDTLFVGQEGTYELGVFVEHSVGDRMRRMEAIAPEMRGMLAYEPPPTRSDFAPRIVHGRRYDAHVYERAIFPLAPGRWVIPPARLIYALPLTSSFFSREETIELRSDSVVVQVIEPPLATRPADYSGAVGQIGVDAWVDAATPRVGDPIGFTVRVSGAGNVKLFPRPALRVSWADVVPAAERVDAREHVLGVHGAKEFDWVLTPREAGHVVLPPVRYVYFDPQTERYEVASTRALPLTVAPGTLARADSGAPARPARLALRDRYRGPIPQPPYRDIAFWLLLAVAPIPALALAVVRRPRTRRARSAAARLDAAGTGRARDAAGDEVRRTLVAAIADRLHVPREAIAEPRAMERMARRAGVSPDTAAAAAALLAELYAAAFDAGHRGESGTSEPPADVAARARRIYHDIDREARPAGAWPVTARRAGKVLGIVVLLGAAVHVAAAATGDADAERFALGVDAYRKGSVSRAMGDFQVVARHEPRAADAWANFGTAAWEMSDTADAVLGWQRALRLEPLARDVRQRLEFVPVSAARDGASVLPVPPTAPAVLAALLWLVGWGTIAWRVRRGRARDVRARPRMGVVLVAAALILGAGAAVLDRRLALDDLGVVARVTPVRAVPDLGAAPDGMLSTGEIARIAQHRGAWAQVDAGGGVTGWVDAGDVLPMSPD
ncbi:MAG TPA: hypothetical protein VFK13_00290 [Gemmatimonadaceae bacterium]|nr:hypothetical protein [Gemmatimonadaceae bacterium]